MKQSASKGFIAALLAVAAYAGTADAAQPKQQFSADTYQKAPQGGEQQGRIYVGDDRVRTEMEQNGEQVIQIVDNNQKVQWVIFPSQRSYMEQRAAATLAAPAATDNNPCNAIPGATCNRLGDETLSGRVAEKWEVQMSFQGRTQRMVQWIDTERGMALRSEGDQGRMELKLVGQDAVSGRPVEKWELHVTQGDKPPQRSYQWYDPQLGLTVREEMPGGFVRELRNIQVGTQPQELFALPAGFQKIDPQQMQRR